MRRASASGPRAPAARLWPSRMRRARHRSTARRAPPEGSGRSGSGTPLRDPARERGPRGAANRPALGTPPLGRLVPRASLRGHPQALRDRGGHPDVDTPRSASILATLPFSGSKKSVVTLSQPPRPSSLIVNSPGGVGYFDLFLSSTDLTTGR